MIELRLQTVKFRIVIPRYKNEKQQPKDFLVFAVGYFHSTDE